MQDTEGGGEDTEGGGEYTLHTRSMHRTGANLAVWRHVAEERHAPADRVELLNVELGLSLGREREQVQHPVGRAAQRVHHRDRVLKRLARHDVARADFSLHHFKQAVDGGDAILQLALAGLELPALVCGGGGARSGRAHSERLHDGRHRDRGEHGRAGASARQRQTLNFAEFLHVDQLGPVRSNRLHHTSYIRA